MNAEIEPIRRYYDRLSLFYRLFWGEHLHHGYWDDGESLARARIQLTERLAGRAAIPRGARVLDIGCGLGGSALWLAENFGCDVTGMTISPVEARIAAKNAKARGLSERVRFNVADANAWLPDWEHYDAIWALESSEYFRDKPEFFIRCARALKPGGVLAMCARLRREGAPRPDEDALLNAIGAATFSASLDSLSDDRRWMEDAGLKVSVADDITAHVARTWDYCSRLAAKPLVKLFVRFVDEDTRRFVRAFPLMKQAYAQGAMAYGLFVAKK